MLSSEIVMGTEIGQCCHDELFPLLSFTNYWEFILLSVEKNSNKLFSGCKWNSLPCIILQVLICIPEISNRSVTWAWIRAFMFIGCIIPTVVAGIMSANDYASTDQTRKYFSTKTRRNPFSVPMKCLNSVGSLFPPFHPRPASLSPGWPRHRENGEFGKHREFKESQL